MILRLLEISVRFEGTGMVNYPKRAQIVEVSCTISSIDFL